MNICEKFDIYSWILSQEIREELKKKPALSIMDQAEIVYNAYRSVGDKLGAFTCLLNRAETKQEREYMERIAVYYQFALRQMEADRRRELSGDQGIKEIWTGICSYYDLDSIWKDDYFTDFYLFYSYEEAEEWAAEYVKEPWTVCRLKKWILGKEKPEDVLECSLRLVGDQLCVTHIYMEEKKWGLKSIDEITYSNRLPYPLPFSTGDLVKLDGPIFSEPIFGVWWEEMLDCQYNWMGRLKTEKEKTESLEKENISPSPYTMDSMSYYKMNHASELCVMDWLCSASEEELPKEQKVLAEIGKELRELRKESSRKAEKRFFEIFGK
ncbi:hypothetical protein AALB16_02955 [Lachnospiraceae bacterium 62-35]